MGTHVKQAIETEYRGYKFRSRLEARWAVFFDAMGIEWKYEPEGFIAGDVPYLPDFYLPATDTWVEVKGTDEALRADAAKLTAILDFGSPMSGITDSFLNKTQGGLLLLGDIPRQHLGLVLHPLVQHHKGLVLTWAAFVLNDDPACSLCILPHEGCRTWLNSIFAVPRIINQISEEADWTCKSVLLRSECTFNGSMEAYDAARQARFEFGQQPRVGKWAHR